MKRLILALALLPAMAFALERYELSDGQAIEYRASGDAVKGEWTSQFGKASATAESEDAYLLVFWANNGCGHCAALEKLMCGSEFRTWQQSNDMYMTFNVGGYPGACGKEADAAKAAAKDPSGEFPYVALYKGDRKLGSSRGTA